MRPPPETFAHFACRCSELARKAAAISTSRRPLTPVVATEDHEREDCARAASSARVPQPQREQESTACPVAHRSSSSPAPPLPIRVTESACVAPFATAVS